MIFQRRNPPTTFREKYYKDYVPGFQKHIIICICGSPLIFLATLHSVCKCTLLIGILRLVQHLFFLQNAAQYMRQLDRNFGTLGENKHAHLYSEYLAFLAFWR